MRKALCVGIDYYEFVEDLYGCVADAYSVKSALDRNSDGTVNFSVNIMAATGEDTGISRKELKTSIEKLFADESEVALFYYAGHGYIESTGGYLITSECKEGDDGFPLSELLTIASTSKAMNKVIILDSCHSGAMGKINQFQEFSLISEGMTILTACSEKQYASEENGHGVFTSLLVDALYGGAMNLVGEVTPGSVYAHIDQALGPWEQRPLFKTNVRNFVSLRKNTPPISLLELHQLTELFPDFGNEFQLDSTFEPDSPNPVKENNEKFRVLQNYNRVNLLVPVGADHMYYAAMESKSCKLTPLGIHYWKLVKNGRI